MTSEEKKELDFLRFFYEAAGDIFGSDDCYDIIADSYKGELPDIYKSDFDDELEATNWLNRDPL